MRCNDKGQVLISAAVTMTVLLGFAGLAVDMGILRYEKRVQQTAADAAAIAGANELRYNSASGMKPAARCASATNSFADSLADPSCAAANSLPATVTINNPPSQGPHTSAVGNCGPTGNGSCYVEAIVTADHPTYFMKIFNINRATVSARAVATLANDTGNACIYTLDTNGGITFSGNLTFNAPNCGVSDNGSCTINGASGTVTVGSLGVGGTNGCGTGVKQAPVPDPLSYLTPPTSCTNLGSVHFNNTAVVSLAPGTYCVQDFKVDGGATVCNSVSLPSFPPSTSGNCSGMPTSSSSWPGSANSGVTFYVTGTVNINGGATVQLSAPSSGPYAGILFYQSRTDTNGAKLNGNSNSYYQGGLYFPSATLAFGGTGFTNTTAQYTVIVSYDLTLSGNPTVNVQSDNSLLPAGPLVRASAVLVE